MLDFDLRMVLQIFGALLCVANYLLIQMRRITATQPLSLGFVAGGGVILLASAIMGGDWGLILLEVSWLVMVAVTLVIRRREALAAAGVAGASVMDTGEFAAVEAVEAPVVAAASVADTAEIAIRAPVSVFDMGNTGELELAGAAR